MAPSHFHAPDAGRVIDHLFLKPFLVTEPAAHRTQASSYRTKRIEVALPLAAINKESARADAPS
jgi:hypothetical protein